MTLNETIAAFGEKDGESDRSNVWLEAQRFLSKTWYHNVEDNHFSVGALLKFACMLPFAYSRVTDITEYLFNMIDNNVLIEAMILIFPQERLEFKKSQCDPLGNIVKKESSRYFFWKIERSDV